MKHKYLILFGVAILSPWFWRIENISLWLAILLLLATVSLSDLVEGKCKIVFLFFLILLVFVQINYTSQSSLTQISNDDRRVVDMHLRAYPPVYISIFGKTLWIPAAHWFEQRKELLVFSRLQNNLFENLDLNQYFFAGHPKERLDGLDYEKFSYVFLPFALIGWYTLVNRSKALYWSYITFSVFVFSLLSNHSILGPMILFPGIVVSISVGLSKILQINDANL